MGICPNKGGRGSPGSQPLNRFLKNSQNPLKRVKNTKTFLGGVGLTLRDICLLNFLHWVSRGDISQIYAIKITVKDSQLGQGGGGVWQVETDFQLWPFLSFEGFPNVILLLCDAYVNNARESNSNMNFNRSHYGFDSDPTSQG